MIRLMGKRGLAEMSGFDIVVVLLLAEIVGAGVMVNDGSITGIVVSAVTLGVLNIAFNFVAHQSSFATRLLQGKSTTIIEDGKIVTGSLNRLGITESELDHTVRSQQGDDISEIGYGKITPSGKIVLTLKPEEQSANKADVAKLTDQLNELRALLTARG